MRLRPGWVPGLWQCLNAERYLGSGPQLSAISGLITPNIKCCIVSFSPPKRASRSPGKGDVAEGPWAPCCLQGPLGIGVAPAGRLACVACPAESPKELQLLVACSEPGSLTGSQHRSDVDAELGSSLWSRRGAAAQVAGAPLPRRPRNCQRGHLLNQPWTPGPPWEAQETAQWADVQDLFTQIIWGHFTE